MIEQWRSEREHIRRTLPTQRSLDERAAALNCCRQCRYLGRSHSPRYTQGHGVHRRLRTLRRTGAYRRRRAGRIGARSEAEWAKIEANYELQEAVQRALRQRVENGAAAQDLARFAYPDVIKALANMVNGELKRATASDRGGARATRGRGRSEGRAGLCGYVHHHHLHRGGSASAQSDRRSP